MIIKCKRCGYEWNTTTEMWMISCPSCGIKNKTKGELNPSEENEGDASYSNVIKENKA